MSSRQLAVLFAALSSTGAALAQTPGPTAVPTPLPTPWIVHSPELLVNASTTGEQNAPAVARAVDLGFVVAWASDGQDGDGEGVFARVFDSAEDPVTGELPVNVATTGRQSEPSVASDLLSGNFVVVWSSDPNGTGATEIFGRRYGPAGAPLGSEFQVNTYTTGRQHAPRVAMNDDGFVVVWTSVPAAAEGPQDGDQSGIYAQRFDAGGVPIGSEFRVNTYTTGDQRAANVAISFSGEFVVVWESEGQDGDLTGIFGQRYDGTGSLMGGEIPVNAFTTGAQTQPDVRGGADFIIVWSSTVPGPSVTDIFARAFHLTGVPLREEFRVNTHTTGAQTRARIQSDFSAVPFGFMIVWESEGQDDPASAAGQSLYAQRFDNAPTPTQVLYLTQPHPRRGPEYLINTQTTGSQSKPDLTAGLDGRFVIVWEGSGQDSSGSGINARRFGFPGAARMDVDQVASGGTSNLNGVLEAGERVRVDPFWTNTGGSGASLPLVGIAQNILGPTGPSYAIEDPNGNYGVINEFFTNDCRSATGNCYEMTIAGTRPAMHWDATYDESLTSTSPIGSPLVKTWALHVGGSFNDVAQDAFYPFIENIFHNRVTAGGGCGAGNFCGEEGVLRQQMAVFLVKAAYGADFQPAPATGTVFDDVPAANPFAPWIEELARLGVTAGCTAPPPPALPSYCPLNTVNRQQMAVFLLKTLYGGQYVASVCNNDFDDVACTNPFAPYIEVLALQGIAAGCQASPPLYCPTDPTKRKQMAAFLVRTFGLQLYGRD